MNCPTCTSTLRTLSYEGVSIETCDGCGGEFVAGQDMARIIKVRDERFTEPMRSALAARGPVFGVADADATTRFCCPSCKVPMNPINYAGDSGVVVDRCGGCGGMWLEHSELEKVQILLEKWEDQAPSQVRGVAAELRRSQEEARQGTARAYSASRFSFVNAIVNRFLDAA
jgi:Zn-finger nucleic acid-binding protein